MYVCVCVCVCVRERERERERETYIQSDRGHTFVEDMNHEIHSGVNHRDATVDDVSKLQRVTRSTFM